MLNLEQLAQHVFDYKNGDKRALEPILKKIQQMIMDVLCKHFNSLDDQDKKDIRQEVNIKIEENIHTLDEPMKLQGWIYRIVRN